LENGFTKPIGHHTFYVRRYENGSDIVFRNPPRNHKTPVYRISEIQIKPLEEANKLLAVSDQFELVGIDPIKVVKEHFFAVLGKKEKVG